MIQDSPVSTKYHYDHSSDRLYVERVQDVGHVIEANKVAANAASTNWTGEIHKVASIPLVVIEKYKNEKGIDLMRDPVALRRFLNDPDNKFLRTKTGTI